MANLDRREALIHALEVLQTGHSAGFEDVLWLCFGDEWTGVLTNLLERDLARYNPRTDDYHLTSLGRASLLQARSPDQAARPTR